MWALYETDCFDGAVCCSGSLWYPGWMEYINQHKINKTSKIYLSLGKKEEKTKHPVMKSVGDSTRLQYEILRQNKLTKNVILEWNEGGHFGNTVQRVSDGISWILQSQSDGRK
jgi:predicted alpha/beta superfamily hydrolase